MDERQKIAILGGTGNEGGGIALRLAAKGYTVLIGSRDSAKATAKAEEIAANARCGTVEGHDLVEAARRAQIVILTVPYQAQIATIETVRTALAGKILVDATVPLIPPKVSRVQLPAQGSAVANVQAILGEAVRVVAAFQNVSAHHIGDLAHDCDCDVLVFGDSGEACDIVIALVEAMGMRGIYGGAVCNAAAAEALTSVLIAINRRYQVPGGAGIHITGLPTSRAHQ